MYLKFFLNIFPEFAEFLVKNKIESISLNPDAVIKTITNRGFDIMQISKKSKKNKKNDTQDYYIWFGDQRYLFKS